ncbi:MAG: hypothetical protein ABR607_06490 [Pyrinomonadaceae bacterium]
MSKKAHQRLPMNLQKIIFTPLCFVILWACVAGAEAQSSDQSLPTAVFSSDINGKIAALDVGDPRATRHFYAFAANPGDLLITVDSRNLNGDVDVFTAITLRPLMKTTIYASTQSTEITKGIYLRAHQILILRVEARTPNDEPGVYHIRFGGTFEPFSSGIPVAENTESAESSTKKGAANRLSSVGATIPRPPGEVKEAAEAKPSPVPPAEKSSSETEALKKETEKPVSSAASRRTPTPGPRRGARPAPARRQPPAKKPDRTARTEKETPSKTESPNEDRTTPTEKAAETKTPSEKPKAQETSAPPAGTRLIIEEKDGTRIERPMATVRRVVIEGTTIVIVLKTGKIERVAMSDVSRMSIEPQ